MIPLFASLFSLFFSLTYSFWGQRGFHSFLFYILITDNVAHSAVSHAELDIVAAIRALEEAESEAAVRAACGALCQIEERLSGGGSGGGGEGGRSAADLLLLQLRSSLLQGCIGESDY